MNFVNLCNQGLMDKKIKKIAKDVKIDAKKEDKEIKELAKMDKKRDKVCSLGEKMMKQKKAK